MKQFFAVFFAIILFYFCIPFLKELGKKMAKYVADYYKKRHQIHDKREKNHRANDGKNQPVATIQTEFDVKTGVRKETISIYSDQDNSA